MKIKAKLDAALTGATFENICTTYYNVTAKKKKAKVVSIVILDTFYKEIKHI